MLTRGGQLQEKVGTNSDLENDLVQPAVEFLISNLVSNLLNFTPSSHQFAFCESLSIHITRSGFKN